MPSYLPFTVNINISTVPHFCSILILADWALAEQLDHGDIAVILSLFPCLISSTYCQNNSCMSKAISVEIHKVFLLRRYTDSHGTRRAGKDEACSECTVKKVSLSNSIYMYIFYLHNRYQQYFCSFLALPYLDQFYKAHVHVFSFPSHISWCFKARRCSEGGHKGISNMGKRIALSASASNLINGRTCYPETLLFSSFSK